MCIRDRDTRVSLKQALAAQGFKGGSRSETEWNQWVQSEKKLPIWGGSYLLRPLVNRYIIPGDFAGLGKMLGMLIGIYLTQEPVA